MSNETLFFVLGSLLVLGALGISFFGLRTNEFPPRRPVQLGLTALFAALVLGTALYSVLNAEDEQEHREHELAAEEEAAAAEDTSEGATGGAVEQAEKPSVGGGAIAPGAGGPGEPTSAGSTLDVTSPEDGSLVFEPDGLEAKAGEITINYDNPSPVDHSIAVEDDGGVLGESDTVTGAEVTLRLTDVAPGEYVYYCTVPGHREAGMEGDLTVSQ